MFSTRSGQYGRPPRPQQNPNTTIGGPAPNSMGQYSAPPTANKSPVREGLGAAATPFMNPFHQGGGAIPGQALNFQQPVGTKPGSVGAIPRQGGGAKPDRGRQRQNHNQSRINKWLGGDEVYQDAISALTKSLEQFRVQNKQSRGYLTEDRDEAIENLLRQKRIDESNMQGDYAARGLVNSGLFGKANSDYLTNFQTVRGDLGRDYRRNIADLLQELSQFRQNVGTEKQMARTEAIRRRAAQLGIRN